MLVVGQWSSPQNHGRKRYAEMERFMQSNDLYTKQAILSRLDSKDIVKEIRFFKETDSTNNEAKRGVVNGDVSGTLYISEHQTQGRGRCGRSWLSSEGDSVLMSLMFKPDIKPEAASMLTLIAALAAVKAIDEPDCKIKWPNDIVLSSKKICGILTEMSTDKDGEAYIVVGVGINVNATEFDEEISKTASSVYNETGKFTKRSDIVVRFVKNFTGYYEIFKKTSDLSALMNEYNLHLVNIDKEVRIIENENEFTGRAIGINDSGALLVKRQNGAVVEIISGEVSVRGLYGYV